jgi:SAM-dependent MidA family methyltransferase
MQLSDIIIKKIKEKGPLSFHDFMEMALYYPDYGYYTSERSKIGPAGDYYTSVSLTPLFGEMIARQIVEMWQHMGEPEFTIVEYGAGNGFLCRDILYHLSNYKKLYEHLTYGIIEKSAAMREEERIHLNSKVKWYNSIKEVPPFTGCVISNELLDNFAVHEVVMEDDLMEIYVDHNGEYTELLRPAPDAVRNYFKELDIHLLTGQRAEANIEATEWISEIASVLEKGYVLTVDYGFSSAELYSTDRSRGTLMCYKGHQGNENPYIDIGMQDITSHVNFSALHHWGAKNGLQFTGYASQAEFLIALGIKDRLINQLLLNGRDSYLAYRKNAFILHQLLFDMGQKFKVLIQQKGLPEFKLTGLQLATSGEQALLSGNIQYSKLSEV